MRFIKFIFSWLVVISFYSTCLGEYFQQEVHYTIHVSLNDKKHELSAEEVLIYKNNSKNSIEEIYFHLWPAAYKDNNTALAKEFFKNGDSRMLSAGAEDFGTIDSLDFRVNGETVSWKTLNDTADVCLLKLNKPLNPGDSITISTPFHVKIPAAYISRLGHEGQAYYITQWYPKPAVYDANGWNYFPYHDKGEFYSEFGTFDVYISLPENYVIAATGLLVDGDKEYTWLDNNDSLTRANKTFPENDSIPPSSKQIKTLHFRQDRIHDFAWFADKRWHVLKDTILLDNTNRKIISRSYFTNKNAKYWMAVPHYIKDAIRYYSNWVGDYPYDQVSAVDVGGAAGGGMEYLMITAIGNYRNAYDMASIIVHEVGHNWFYGILGSNERYHPWMDEGINEFYTTRYVYTKNLVDPSLRKPKNKFSLNYILYYLKPVNYQEWKYTAYILRARRNSDQPPELCSDKFSFANYHGDVYSKTAVSLDYLKSYLGDSLFDSSIRDYYSQWKFKHPMPDDLKLIFEKHTDKRSDWFFNDIIQTNKKLDYKICSIKTGNDKTADLTIKNTKQIDGPLALTEIKNNKTVKTTWIEGFSGTQKIKLSCDDCDSYQIDRENKFPELYRKNNFIRTKGLFKKMEQLKFSFKTGRENPNQTQIFYSPVAGWNNYNKLMAGIVLHNITIFENKFEYTLMPMYATGTKDLSGGGKISYHFYPLNSKVYRISIENGICRYAFGHDSYETVNKDFSYSNALHFTKIDSKIIFSFLQKNRKEHLSHKLIIRNIFVDRDIPYSINYKKQDKNLDYRQIEFRRENTNPLAESLQRINVTAGEKFWSASGEIKYFFNYGTIKKGLQLRAFAGYVSIPKETTYGIDYKMSLSGRDGGNDYLFDGVFPGRTEEEGVLSKQFVNDYAGFKTPTSFFRKTDNWMSGVNLYTTLPGLLPFRLFANAGSFYHSDLDGVYGKISWEMGVDLPLIKDIFVISLPFAYSKDIKYAVDQQEFKPLELMRFELNLNLANPIELIKNRYPD